MFYYIRHQGREQGPLSVAQLLTLLSRGTVTKETETFVDEAEWKTLDDFSGESPFFPSKFNNQPVIPKPFWFSR